MGRQHNRQGKRKKSKQEEERERRINVSMEEEEEFEFYYYLKEGTAKKDNEPQNSNKQERKEDGRRTSCC